MQGHYKFIFFFLSILFILNIEAFTQEGDYLLSHHSHSVEGLDNINFQMAVDSKGQLCIANRSGVLLFDGTNWDYLPTPSAVLSIALDSEDNIYVGCVSGYGTFGFRNNKYQYLSLDESAKNDDFYFSTISLDSAAYFLSEDSLIEFDYFNRETKSYKLDSSSYFNNIFEYHNELLIQTDKGYLQIAQDSLIKVTFPKEFPDEIATMRKSKTDNSYLLLTGNSEVYSLLDGKLKELKSSKYLNENGIYVNDVQWIDESTYAVSTLENGCLLFEISGEKPLNIVNYHKGLPDNEIFCITVDSEQGLWLAHEFGLSRIESSIPVRSFSNYPGIEGNLIQSTVYDDKLYLSTSHGVYYLDSENQYKYSVYYTPKKSGKAPRQKSNTNSANQKTQSTSAQNESGKKKRRIKNFLKKIGKNDKADDQVQQAKAEEEEKPKKKLFGRIAQKISKFKDDQLLKIKKSSLIKNIKYERKVKSEIVSKRYLYKQITGLNTKSKQFIEFQDMLLVASNSGIYEIHDQSAELVIHEPVRFVEVDEKGENLIISTYNNEVKVYERHRNIWVENNSFDFFGEIILSILSDSEGKTWLASANRLFKVDSIDADQQEMTEYGIPNHFIDDVKLAMISDRISIINSLGYFYLDESQNKVVVDSATYKIIGEPRRHLQQNDGSVWVFNGKKWFRIDKDGSINPFEQLGLFAEMSYVGREQDDIWLINDYSELFKFNIQQYDSLVSSNQMFLKRVENNSGHVDLKGDLIFAHNDNTLQFVLSRPDYLGLLKVEYQYKLDGLNDNWSSWHSNNNIDFSYLPPNRYSLLVRSRDSFGNIQESEPFEFRIKPPYWQTTWFYALQIIIMSVLVIGSARMNRQAERKYVLVTEGLTILTIVLIIEFLQTIAQNSFGIQASPVADFGINVLVALCVFPLEQFLKKVMRADPSVPGLSGKGIFDLLAMVRKK